jgi:hypothetical protein
MSGFLDLMGATAGALALIDRLAENPASRKGSKVRSFPNIEKSAFKKGAYVGYGHNSVYMITGGSGYWRATRQSGNGPATLSAASLGEMSAALELKDNPRSKKKRGDLGAALSALISQIGMGREYPDAEFSVSQQFNVSAAKLRAAYDNLETFTDDELARDAAVAKAYGLNPRARKTAKRVPIKRAGIPAKKYAARPSQITRAKPSKRLKARRAAHIASGMPAGVFPNPVLPGFVSHADARGDYRYEIQEKAPAGNWVTTLATNSKKDAKSHAQYIADKTGKTVRIVDRHS